MRILLFTLMTTLLPFFCNSQFIDITDYGASTALGDNAAQIQQAIDDNPEKTIFVPSGLFKIRTPLQINHKLEIVGEGHFNSIIQPINCNGFVVTSSNVTFRNLFVYGYANSLLKYTGIYCGAGGTTTISDLNFDKVKLQNIYTGIELKYARNCVLNNVVTKVNPNQHPIVHQAIRFYGQSVNNQMSNCNIETIKVGEFNSTHDFNNNIESIGGIGVSIIRARTSSEQNTPIADLTLPRAEGLMITNSFIGRGRYGIYSEGILSLNISNSTIDLTTRSAIVGTRTDGMLLSNNWIATTFNEVLDHPIIKIIKSSNCHLSTNNIQYNNNNNIVIPVAYRIGLSFEDDSNHCTVIGNTFKFMDKETANVTGANNNTVVYNILQNL